MANTYYNAPADNQPLTTIRSGDENSDRAAVEAAFDKLPSEDDIIRSQFGTDVSTAATLYEITITTLPGAYFVGLEVNFEATFTSTGAASIQVNGSTIVPLLDAGGTALVVDSITIGQVVVAVFTSTGDFRLIQSDSASSATSAAASAASAAASEAVVVAVAGTINFVTEHFYRNR